MTTITIYIIIIIIITAGIIIVLLYYTYKIHSNKNSEYTEIIIIILRFDLV